MFIVDGWLSDCLIILQFHADLYHMVCELSSDEGMDRMRNTDFRFVDTVYQLLAATRLITYS